jgi:hypothetical protein
MPARGRRDHVSESRHAPAIDLGQLCRRVREIVTSERVEIDMYGDEDARAVYEKFISPHPLCPFIARKSFGAALIHLPTAHRCFLKGGEYGQARRKHRRALACGFTFGAFEARARVDDILAINRSASVRQGKPMPKAYLSRDAVEAFCEDVAELSGVFDAAGRLHAYAYPLQVGDVVIFSRLLGHADSLKLGIMYLLMIGAITQACRCYREHGRPVWAHYDMFWGASPGLRQFKRELGFRPYRVRWHWREPTPDPVCLTTRSARIGEG